MLLSARATSRRPTRVHAYHARDDLLLYALHEVVPPEREGVDAWRCEIYDLVERKFDAWHKWLVKADGADTVPPAPYPPLGGSLYKLDEGKADLLVTTTSLYPCDHHTLRYTHTEHGATCTIEPRGGGYARVTKTDLVAGASDFAIAFSDGARAAVVLAAGGAAGGAWELSYGGSDRLQIGLTCAGKVRMAPPPAAAASTPRDAPSEPATLKLTGLRVAGAAVGDGAQTLTLKVALLEGPLPEAEAGTEAAAFVAEGTEFAASLALPLPMGSARPPLLRFELWDKDSAADPEAAPVATAEARMPDAAAGELIVTYPPAAEGGEGAVLSGSYEVDSLIKLSQV